MIRKRKIVYRSQNFNVERAELVRDGKHLMRDRIVGPDTVIVIPFLDKSTVVMEYQYRFPIDKSHYELPAGHIDKGETPEHAAARELEEETGYRPSKLELLYKAYPVPGTKSEKMYAYVATGLRKTKSRKEEDEFIDTRLMKLERLLKMIDSNEIDDMKTISAVLYYLRQR